MMPSLRPIRILLVLLMAWPATAFAQDAARGASVLARAREAVGGERALAAVATLQLEGVVRRSGGPMNMNLEGELKLAFARPDKFRRDEVLGTTPGGPSLERTEVVNGADSWESGNGGRGMGFFFRGGGPGAGMGGGGGAGIGPGGGQPGNPPDAPGGPGRRQPTPEELERLRTLQAQNRRAEFGRLLLAFLLSTDAPAAWVGTAQSPDGTADVVEIRPAGEPAVRLFVDSESHLPLMMTWVAGPMGGRFMRRGGPGGPREGAPGAAQAPAPGAPLDGVPPPPGDGAAPPPPPGGGRGRGAGTFQPPTFEMHLSDYKRVDKVLLPHLITRGINGETNEEIEVKRYRVNPALKAETFAR